MNLLKTGVILKIPDLQDLAEISEKEADRTVNVQVNDWHKYRQNLALSTQEQQAADALSQADEGQITTAIDNAAVAQNVSPEEVLRLSGGGERFSESQDGDFNSSTQDRLRMMEEDAIARNLALKEATERVAMLEKNIENLQKLLALQNPELAQAQINAEGAAVQAETQTDPLQAEIESIEVIPSESADSILATETEFDSIAESDSAIELDAFSETDNFSASTTNEVDNIASEAVSPAAPAASAASVSNPVLIPESKEPSFLDQVTGNLTYIGAAFAILLLALFAVFYRRRREAAEAEAEAEESRYEELSSALRNKTAEAVAVARTADNKHDDSDDFEQSTQFLQEDSAQEKEGDARPDLSTSSAEQTNTLESESYDAVQPIELDFSKENEQAEKELNDPKVEPEMNAYDGSRPEIEKTDELSRESETNDFDPNADFGMEKPSISEELSDPKTELDEKQFLNSPTEALTQTDSEADHELKFDFDESNDAAKSDAMKLDLADQEPDTDAMQASAPNAENTLDFSVDSSAFELSDDNKMNEEKSSDVDFSNIDLDLEKEHSTEASDNQVKDEQTDTVELASPESEVKSEQWQEVETKIDLAKAYLEMEDMEGAREMLEEVIQEGDENQQKAAKALLEKL